MRCMYDRRCMYVVATRESFSPNVFRVRGFLRRYRCRERKEYQETFYPGLPENLPVKRCTQFKVATSVRPGRIKGQTREASISPGSRVLRSAAFFSPPILVINFQVVQRRPAELRNDVIDGAREQEGWLLRIRSQPSAHTNVDLPEPILRVTTSDCGSLYTRFWGGGGGRKLWVVSLLYQYLVRGYDGNKTEMSVFLRRR